MKNPYLNEPRSWTGHWWIPDSEDAKVPGVLSYDPSDGIKLELIGGWEYRNLTQVAPGVITVHGGMRNWPVVHGFAEGKRITLLDTWGAGAVSRILGAAPDTMRVRAHTVLVGVHLSSRDEPAFIRSNAVIERMTRWANLGGMVVKLHTKEDRKSLSGAGTIEIEPPESHVVEHGDWSVAVEPITTLPGYHFTRMTTSAEASVRASVVFKSKSPKSLDDLTTRISAFSDLVSLFTLTPCGVIYSKVYLPSDEEAKPDGGDADALPIPIEVYQRRSRVADPEHEEDALEKIIATLDELEFRQLVPTWFDVRERYSAAIGMVISLWGRQNDYIESEVITSVGAAEAMHRSFEPDPPIEQSEFKRLRKVLLEAVPKERKQWLASILQRNEPSLRQRLLDLAERPGECMKQLVPNPVRWASAAVKARNEFAHTGESSEQDPSVLHAVVVVTTAVVVVNLLHILGVPEEKIARAIDEHRYLSNAAYLANRKFATEQ